MLSESKFEQVAANSLSKSGAAAAIIMDNYQMMDVSQQSTQSRTAYRRAIGAIVGVKAIGGVMMVLLTVWLYSYNKPGFGWDSDLLFKYHPLFMTSGLVFFNGKVMLIYRLLRNKPKLPVKIAHACLNLVTMSMAIAGLVVVIKNKNNMGFAHFYSVHSWIGIGTFALFEFQWFAGFLVFLYPGGSPQMRAAALRIHRFCGAAIFALACVSVLTGVVSLAGKIDNYNQLPWSARVLNAFSMTLVLFACGVFLLLSVDEYRRPPN